MTSLSAIVESYKAECRENSAGEYRYYASRKSLAEVVKIAAFARDPRGKRHPHQARLTHTALAKVYRRLKRTNLRDCRSFHELFRRIDDVIGPIQGIGPLMVYDTALRIGAYLHHAPRKIYLHSGTRNGARAIGLGKAKDTLKRSELPPEFHKLRPREIEDCLCVYKDELRAIYGT